VATFLLGYGRHRSACLEAGVQWALDGSSIGLPLVVEVRATGPRVSIPTKRSKLGVVCAGSGADAIVIPYPGASRWRLSPPWSACGNQEAGHVENGGRRN
jgi:hypothetical protein